MFAVDFLSVRVAILCNLDSARSATIVMRIVENLKHVEAATVRFNKEIDRDKARTSQNPYRKSVTFKGTSTHVFRESSLLGSTEDRS